MANIKDLQLRGRRVLLRVDFNVPIDKETGDISDDTRIRAALPTIEYLRAQGAKVILLSHYGRPKPNADGSRNLQKFGLQYLGIGSCLLELLSGDDARLFSVEDCIGKDAEELIAEMEEGDVCLLENTRFYPEEEAGDEAFAQKLAALADVYINDAFGAAHREHASTCTVARFFAPENKAFGFLMAKELQNAEQLLNTPARPYVAILGGAKVSDKILLIESLLEKVDTIVVGGGMAYTFLKAQGGEIGKSLVEIERIDLARELLAKAQQKAVKILLPIDSLCAAEFKNESPAQTYKSREIPTDKMGLDIGEIAIAEFSQTIEQAKTIFWNGPMGVFEMDNFSAGTRAIAESVAKATAQGAFSLVGGGDSVAALHATGKADAVSFVSTGGGAMLELIEQGTLPGVEAIK